MPEERRNTSKHKVIIEKRERVFITGVIDVMSFDEESIVTETEMGTLIIRGVGLHVNALNLEKGELEVDGEIENTTYEDESPLSKNKGSLFGKIFK